MAGAHNGGELLLEGVHLGTERRDPVGVKRLLDVVLFQAGHVGGGEIDAITPLSAPS